MLAPENTSKISCGEGKTGLIGHHGKESPACTVLVASWAEDGQWQSRDIYKVSESGLRQIFHELVLSSFWLKIVIK